MIKFKKVKKICVATTFSVMLVTIKSNAAIQIVPTSEVLTDVTVSTSYKTCRDLDSLSSTLGTTKLDPHLATNKDWGAVSYLANSAYGLNATYPESDIDDHEGKVGVKKKINNIDFYSTTPNVTGVMNWGGNPNKNMFTQTSSLLSNVTADNMGSAENNVSLLFNNIGTKYVESILIPNTEGMAIDETKGWGDLSNAETNTNLPMCIRQGLFRLWNRYALVLE